MHRFLYFAGFTFIALCGASIARSLTGRNPLPAVPFVQVTTAPPVAAAGSGAERWFAAMKPYCNPVEVEVQMRYRPAPPTVAGAGYAAACFGLAGKIERARAIMLGMRPSDRGTAAGVLFNVAHPVADAGDDRASGPMMELVLDYWPNNYMALYHAGMSEYSLGQTALAETHLRDFLRQYNAPDGFTSAAKTALAKIAAGAAERVPRARTSAEQEPQGRR